MAKEGLCPSAVAGSPGKRRVKKEVVVKVDDLEDEVVVKVEDVVVQEDVGIKLETEVKTGLVHDGLAEGSHSTPGVDAAPSACE